MRQYGDDIGRISFISLTLLLILSTVSLLIAPSAQCAPAERPSVLVFAVNADDKVDLGLASTATRAIRDYLRQSGKVEAILFDKKSPLVARAVMESQISPDKIENYDSQKARAEVANALSMDFACGAQMTVELDKVRMSMSLIDARNAKRRWEVPDYIATAGRIDETGMRNAVQSVCSGLVNEIVRMALNDVVAVVPETTSSVPEVSNFPKPADKSLNTNEISNAASESLKQGNTARAIDLYQKAINTNPSDYTLRIKLAEVYHKRGMDTEANEELDRAVSLGADKALVEEARIRIFRPGDVPDSPTVNPASQIKDPNRSTTATTPSTENQANTTVRSQESSVGAGVSNGDKLWNDGDAEGAEQAYQQVIANDPKNWRAYERLAILLAAQYKFTESRKVLTELNLVQPAPPADVLGNRYKWLTSVLDYDVNALLDQMESDIATFESHRISRESCYESIRTAKAQLQSLVVYADDLLYPPEMRQANANRVQACRFGTQAATGLLEYLETNLVKFKNNASIFMEQAKVELLEIVKLVPAQ